jgi:hypothetical protein
MPLSEKAQEQKDIMDHLRGEALGKLGAGFSCRVRSATRDRNFSPGSSLVVEAAPLSFRPAIPETSRREKGFDSESAGEPSALLKKLFARARPSSASPKRTRHIPDELPADADVRSRGASPAWPLAGDRFVLSDSKSSGSPRRASRKQPIPSQGPDLFSQMRPPTTASTFFGTCARSRDNSKERGSASPTRRPSFSRGHAQQPSEKFDTPRGAEKSSGIEVNRETHLRGAAPAGMSPRVTSPKRDVLRDRHFPRRRIWDDRSGHRTYR